MNENVIPHRMDEGNILSLKVGDTIIDTPPIPFKHLPEVGAAAGEYCTAQQEFAAFHRTYEVMERRFNEAEACFKKAVETASNGNGHKPVEVVPEVQEVQEVPEDVADVEPVESPFIKELRESLENAPVQEVPEEPEIPEPEEIVEPESPKQIAENIIDDVMSALQNVPEFDGDEVRAQVVACDVQEAQVKDVTAEIINILQEKGAIEKGSRFKIPKIEVPKLLKGKRAHKSL